MPLSAEIPAPVSATTRPRSRRTPSRRERSRASSAIAPLWHAPGPPVNPCGMSTAVTHGIEVEVHGEFRPERSDPSLGRYLFAYSVRITNGGPAPARLVSRHWL